MRRWRWAVLLASVLLLAADRAAAQDAGKTGVTMGYPGSVGLIWHLSEKVAVRPEISFSKTDQENESAGTVTGANDSYSLGVGGSVLLYVAQWDKLRAYVSPRYTYGRSNTTNDSSVTGNSSEFTTTSHSVTGYFGSQYSLADRFSVFGEIGFGLTHQASTSLPSDSTVTTDSWSTRTGVGVIFYF